MMSNTPETDKAWEKTAGFTLEESKYFLRMHSEKLEFERDRARDIAEKSSMRVFQLRAAIDEICDLIDEFKDWRTCNAHELVDDIRVIAHKVIEV